MKMRGVGLLVVTALAMQCCDKPAGPDDRGKSVATRDASVPPGAVLGVEALMNRRAPPTGVVRVEGVVASVDRKTGLIGLIDVAEFAACNSVSCAAQMVLPVRWAGPPPVLKDQVRVTGEIVKSGGKLVFAAKRFDRIPPSTKDRKSGE